MGDYDTRVLQCTLHGGPRYSTNIFLTPTPTRFYVHIFRGFGKHARSYDHTGIEHVTSRSRIIPAANCAMAMMFLSTTSDLHETFYNTLHDGLMEL